MKAKLIPILIANLFAASAAMAQEPGGAFKFTGSVGLGAIGSNINATDEAKAREYRDLDNGALGTFDIKGRGGNYWVDAFAENIARDDQYFDLKGGSYGMFKYRAYYDQLVHNWALGARTPLNGAGGDVLTIPAGGVNPNPDLWNRYDLKDKRKDWGGMFEFSGGSPYYVRAEYQEITHDGNKLIAGSKGTSPGNGFIDNPFPLDYKTRNFSLEGGYASKLGQLSISAMQSRFSNGKDTLQWQNNYFSSLNDQTTLAADNVQTRFAVNGMARQLPWNSTLSGRFTYANTTNSLPLYTTALSGTGTPAGSNGFFATNPTQEGSPTGTFAGKVTHMTAAVSWHFNPTKAFDIRPYGSYWKKDNSSPLIDYLVGTSPPAPAAGATGLTCGRVVQGATVLNAGDCETETISVRKQNIGVEAGYRISPGNRLIAGYDYLDTTRTRLDINRTVDNRFNLEYRNSMLANLGVRAKYVYLNRDGTLVEPNSGVNANDPNYLNRYVRKYDATDQKQNLIKVMLDYQPAPLWDLGLEGVYREVKYGDTTLGRTKDDRQQLYGSVAWGDMNRFRVLAFADYEQITYDSNHRNISSVSNGSGAGINALPSGFCTTAFPNCFDPNTAANSTNYNWSGKARDWNYAFGVGADWTPMDRLKFKGSYSYSRTKGDANFASQPTPTPIATPVVPINVSDNTKKWALNLKGTYDITKQWAISGGYAWEKYEFSDIAYDGYKYTIPSPPGAQATFNNTTSYLAGQGAFPNYKVQVLWVMGTYKFD